MQTTIPRRDAQQPIRLHPCAPCIFVWMIAAPLGAVGMLRLLWWLFA